ncbi:tetratricopeptide repeat protein [Methanobrevibacter sp.]|uniref:tetratricopeptide repeat protein n=1 Tax=Methanobrevibacter sp. TaxID=66852 RepID=UPI00386CE0BC
MLEDYINSKINEAYDYMQNDSEKALEIFDEVLEIEPEKTQAINGKGSTLMKLNRFDEADECFNHSLSISENSSALLNKGMIAKHRNDFENAMAYFDKALKVNPNLENIINILKSEIIDANDNADETVNELIEKGIKLKDENKLWDSLDILMQAIEEDPSCENQANKLIDEIKTTFEREFIYDDGDFDINSKVDRLKMQAIKALIKENNPEKALTLMDLVLELDENDINTLNHKGGVLFICSDYQKAIECFDKCLSIDENYTCALFNKALVLRVMNKLQDALNCFDELLKTPQNYNKVKPYQLEILDKLNTRAIT